jgi:hypothetical protein
MNITRLDMKSLVVFSLLLFFTVASPAVAVAATADGWSLRYLARASNFILWAFDASLENKEVCTGLASEQVQALPRNLEALIDDKINRLSKSQQSRLLTQAKTCEKECTCDIYFLALQKLNSATNESLVKQVGQKGTTTTPQQRARCAKSFSEFCTSSLLKQLKRP